MRHDTVLCASPGIGLNYIYVDTPVLYGIEILPLPSITLAETPADEVFVINSMYWTLLTHFIVNSPVMQFNSKRCHYVVYIVQLKISVTPTN